MDKDKTRIVTIHLNSGSPCNCVSTLMGKGTHATILKEPSSAGCLVKLPSHVEKWIDSKCRATIGSVPSGPNPGNQPKKLYKAGQSRWFWEVAMNPIDHPHGGGEGKSRGRPSVTPWGKPCKGGYRSGPVRRKNMFDIKNFHSLCFDVELWSFC